MSESVQLLRQLEQKDLEIDQLKSALADSETKLHEALAIILVLQQQLHQQGPSSQSSLEHQPVLQTTAHNSPNPSLNKVLTPLSVNIDHSSGDGDDEEEGTCGETDDLVLFDVKCMSQNDQKNRMSMSLQHVDPNFIMFSSTATFNNDQQPLAPAPNDLLIFGSAVMASDTTVVHLVDPMTQNSYVEFNPSNKMQNLQLRVQPSASKVFPVFEPPPTGAFPRFVPQAPQEMIVRIHQGQSELELLNPHRTVPIPLYQPNSCNNNQQHQLLLPLDQSIASQSNSLGYENSSHSNDPNNPLYNSPYHQFLSSQHNQFTSQPNQSISQLHHQHHSFFPQSPKQAKLQPIIIENLPSASAPTIANNLNSVRQGHNQMIAPISPTSTSSVRSPRSRPAFNFAIPDCNGNQIVIDGETGAQKTCSIPNPTTPMANQHKTVRHKRHSSSHLLKMDGEDFYNNMNVEINRESPRASNKVNPVQLSTPPGAITATPLITTTLSPKNSTTLSSEVTTTFNHSAATKQINGKPSYPTWNRSNSQRRTGREVQLSISMGHGHPNSIDIANNTTVLTESDGNTINNNVSSVAANPITPSRPTRPSAASTATVTPSPQNL